jgi:hypothetical protein
MSLSQTGFIRTVRGALECGSRTTRSAWSGDPSATSVRMWLKSNTRFPFTERTRVPGCSPACQAGEPGALGPSSVSEHGTPTAKTIGKTTRPKTTFASTPPE